MPTDDARQATPTTGADAPDLVIFGGTFDPPHVAHVAAVEQVLTHFAKTHVLVMPAPAPAGAGGAHKSPMAPFADRYAMTRLAFADLGERVQVSALEAELPPPNYTVSTLQKLGAIYPDQRLALLIGQDQLTAFPRWREPEAILALAELVVVPRSEGETRSLEETYAALVKTLPAAAGRIRLLPAPVGEASSQALRDRLTRHDASSADWLPPTVTDYIQRHGLYAVRTP